MKTVVIGLAGAKRAGKDTAAQTLRRCLAEFDQELLVGTTSFASPMYDMLSALLGHDTVNRLRDDDAKDTENIEPFGCTLRHLAQTLGTEWGRCLIHGDIWVMALHRRIMQAAQSADDLPSVVFIPDVRFPNEAQYVRDNGILIHIQRDTGHRDRHTSETPLEIEDTDTVLQNNGTLTEFEHKVISYGRNTLLEDLTSLIFPSAGVSRLLSE